MKGWKESGSVGLSLTLVLVKRRQDGSEVWHGVSSMKQDSSRRPGSNCSIHVTTGKWSQLFEPPFCYFQSIYCASFFSIISKFPNFLHFSFSHSELFIVPERTMFYILFLYLLSHCWKCSLYPSHASSSLTWLITIYDSHFRLDITAFRKISLMRWYWPTCTSYASPSL